MSIGLYTFSKGTLTQVQQNIKSDIKILSSKWALNNPSYLSLTILLIYPLIPDTVLILAPINFYTSIYELNIFFTIAVFLNTFSGSPINLSFFLISYSFENPKTTPVPPILNYFPSSDKFLINVTPVLLAT